MQQEIRNKTKFIYLKIINASTKNVRNDPLDCSACPDPDIRKELGPLNLPPVSHRKRH